MFPGKYHQNGGFSMAMLVYRSVSRMVWGGGGATNPPVLTFEFGLGFPGRW